MKYLTLAALLTVLAFPAQANEKDQRANAMILELQAQVQMLSARSARMAAEVSILRGKLAEAKKPKKKKKPKK